LSKNGEMIEINRKTFGFSIFPILLYVIV